MHGSGLTPVVYNLVQAYDFCIRFTDSGVRRTSYRLPLAAERRVAFHPGEAILHKFKHIRSASLSHSSNVYAYILALLLIFADLAPTFAAPENYGKTIATTARACLGKEMWKPGYRLSNGKLGCAAAVCNVLKKAGIKQVSTAGVVAMRNQLLSLPGSQEFKIRSAEGSEIDDAKLLKIAQPGDIVLAFHEPPSKANSGPNAHCGVMGAGSQVYTNNWMDGIWTEVEIHQMFDYYPYIRLIRLSSSAH
jgi:hypothetical protein